MNFQAVNRPSRCQPSVGTRSGAETRGVTKSPGTGNFQPVSDQLTLSAEARAFAAEKTQEVSDSCEISGSRSVETQTDLETRFKSQFDAYIEILNRKQKIVNDYYGKQNAENKRFASPMQHIQDKYVNYKSRYFRSDMTEAERRIAMEQEIDMLNGKQPKINGCDYALREDGGANIFRMDLESIQIVRNQVGQSIQDLLAENGIAIPDGQSLHLTVDPYDFYIHVEGIGDDALALDIEKALNSGDNGKNLYYQIDAYNTTRANFESDPQYDSSDASWKMSLYHTVKQLTGYDMRELENKDGKFYTPDGQDLWTVLTQKANENPLPNGGSYGLDSLRAIYDSLAHKGWSSIPDDSLGIDYKNGTLTDPGDGWQQALTDRLDKEWAEDQAQRELTLKREAAARAK